MPLNEIYFLIVTRIYGTDEHYDLMDNKIEDKPLSPIDNDQLKFDKHALEVVLLEFNVKLESWI